jgi:hypothetical protein
VIPAAEVCRVCGGSGRVWLWAVKDPGKCSEVDCLCCGGLGVVLVAS